MGAPVGYTCSEIDAVVSDIKDALQVAQDFEGNFDSKSIEDIRTAFETIGSNLDGLESSMEEIRSANDKLRSWGDGMETKADELEKENDNLKEELESIQNA